MRNRLNNFALTCESFGEFSEVTLDLMPLILHKEA